MAEIATELHEALAEQNGPLDQGAFTLAVLEGPDRGQSIAIDGTREMAALVGQSPACSLRLTDPTVSRRHLEVEVSGARLRIRDLGSKNGTLINGVRVIEGFAQGDERIQLGATVLGVTRERDKPSAKDDATTFGGFVTQSRAVRRLFPLLKRLAASSLPVLIEGETGTGKDVLARALHDEGPRATKPFVVFDCAAVASNVIESELFGHEKGAFTGAQAARAGLFEQAHGGTLFLDELGELPLDLQGKLLRAIERSEVRRVGGNQWIKVDVRVIAATRRDIDAYVQDGRFRDDLFHRLAVGRVELPPLRKRLEDVPLLARHFARAVDESAVIPERILEDWRVQTWPGNVRELRNAVMRHVALGEDALEDEPDAPVLPRPAPGGASEIDALLGLKLPYSKARARMLRTFEQRYLEDALATAGGSVQKAAQQSGVAVRYFQLLRARNKGP